MIFEFRLRTNHGPGSVGFHPQAQRHIVTREKDRGKSVHCWQERKRGEYRQHFSRVLKEIHSASTVTEYDIVQHTLQNDIRPCLGFYRETQLDHKSGEGTQMKEFHGMKFLTTTR